ncbi:hypothetical protein [Sporosarcina sp. E16_8]|uniref:hypothetical protein n=1 Tax=Sporosarcina sp. E16_8 TaxID=2789295 RepID=UPI001A9259AB|nr:hypothetical protein [Sporosarcina sp. E16_8]MBO0587705.1 hypothetical protein [Sporosarcina sp. E16_8]
MRFSPAGHLFETKGSVCFVKQNENTNYLLGLLNSIIVNNLLLILSPTLDYHEGPIGKLPVIIEKDIIETVDSLVSINISTSKIDWDNFEMSWNFIKHPLLKFATVNLQSAFSAWKQHTEFQFNQLKANEEELNRIFIQIYGLKDELMPDVEDKDITIRKAELVRDTKSFLSYFIGCTVGRYSLEVEGLAYAGGEWDESEYASFKPNKYGILQFTDAEYFEHDIIARLREFLAVAFQADTVDDNLQWLAEALEMKKGEYAEARLRRYFMDEFFTDHCKPYQKRPIYWLVDSGKQKGLRTLIYMHRYQPDTMATIRFEHLQEIQAKYNNEIDALDIRLVNPNLSATEKRNLEKQKDLFKKRLEELLEFDKKLAKYANDQIGIDLDDGVKVNYAKFDGVLAKIK